MRRLLREQEQAGALPAALTISRDANTGAGQDPHRPDRGGSTPPSCRDWVASIAAMQRSLKPQSTGQHRGDPPISTEAEPDKRAGTVSKTDRAPQVHGEHDLRLPPRHAGLAKQPCTRPVNEIRPGQHR